MFKTIAKKVACVLGILLPIVSLWLGVSQTHADNPFTDLATSTMSGGISQATTITTDTDLKYFFWMAFAIVIINIWIFLLAFSGWAFKRIKKIWSTTRRRSSWKRYRIR